MSQGGRLRCVAAGGSCAGRAHQVEAGRAALREEEVVQHVQAAGGQRGVGAPDHVVGCEARDEEEHGQDADHHALRRQVRQLLPHAAARRAEPPARSHPTALSWLHSLAERSHRLTHRACPLGSLNRIQGCYAAVICRSVTPLAQDIMLYH